MKNKFYLVLLVMSLIISCETEEIINLSNEANTSELIKSDIDLLFRQKSEELNDVVLQTLDNFSTNKNSSSLKNQINFETAIKTFKEDIGISYYSFPFKEKSNNLKQLVLKKYKNQEIVGNIIEFESDSKDADLENQPLENFIGYFRIYDLNEQLLSEIYFGGKENKLSSKSICSSSFTDWYNCRGAIISASTCDYSNTSVNTTCSSSSGGSYWGTATNGSQEDDFYLYTSTFGNTGSATRGSYYPTVIVEETPPSCKSFDFKKSTSTTNWQEARVVNIRFNVWYVEFIGGVKFRKKYTVNIKEPVRFGMPITFYNAVSTKVAPGLAAEIASIALNHAMDDVVSKYYNLQINTTSVIKKDFETFLKNEFRERSNGGRVNFNDMGSYPPVTQYKTYGVIPDDCY